MGDPVLYRLKADVKNPKPDRRSEDFYRRTTWRKGMIFVVCQEVLEHAGDKPVRTFERVFEWRGFQHQGIRERAEAFEEQKTALMAEAELLPADHPAWIFPGTYDRPGVEEGYSILLRLLKSKKITAEDVRAAYEADSRGEGS